ncbi:MAG: class I SAM-dependent methyltransferase [Gemmata sp.]
MPIPDWQLPAGVDRGLWDYLHAANMVSTYDEQMRASPLAAADVAFCERAFATPGRVADLGCGTGRLCVHLAARGFACVGVDLSDDMLTQARANAASAGVNVEWVNANLVDLPPLADASFDYAACLFSTLGMIREAENRTKAILSTFRVLKPGGRFVLHVHNRYFRGLGRKRVWGQRLRTLFAPTTAGDITMSQAYGGAALTLHHYAPGHAERLVDSCGFRVKETSAVGIDGLPARGGDVYGWLLLAERPL